MARKSLTTMAEYHALIAKPGKKRGVSFKPALVPCASISGSTYCLDLPIKVVSEANSRQRNRAERIEKVEMKRAQKEEVRLEWLKAFKRVKIKLPCVVTLTRIGPKHLDDDNLRSSFKAIRDSIAELIGVDDGSDQIRFEYEQEVIKRRAYGIRIKVES